MKDKLVLLFSKMNKGIAYILGINIVFFSVVALCGLLNISSQNSIYFLVFGFPIVFISIFFIPIIIVYTSPKFTKKEKKKFLMYFIGIYLFILLILNFFIANYFTILYWFYTGFLFWTHRKNDYSKEEIIKIEEETKE